MSTQQMGPFATRAEAREAASGWILELPEKAIGSFTPARLRNVERNAALRFITKTLKSAGVELGEYDEFVAAWLATQSPELFGSILGWVLRSGRGGAVSEPPTEDGADR